MKQPPEMDGCSTAAIGNYRNYFDWNNHGDASGNASNYTNPNCEAILSNPAKYIAPLQTKGIKVLMGNLGDHTGLGFANLTEAQVDQYINDLLDYEGIVDGYDFDDEWAKYGEKGYPQANSTSYSMMINKLSAGPIRLFPSLIMEIPTRSM